MPRTPEQNKNIREKRKRKLILHALKAFAEFGYDDLTIDDITKVAKCSHGLFYHYYDAKEQIYEDVVRFYVYPLCVDPKVEQIKAEGGAKGLNILVKWAFEILKQRDTSAYALIVLCNHRLASTYQPTGKYQLPSMDIKGLCQKLIKEAIANKEIIQATEEDIAIILNDLLYGAERRFLLNKKDDRTLSPEFLNTLFQYKK